jgi:hypothetical protein
LAGGWGIQEEGEGLSGLGAVVADATPAAVAIPEGLKLFHLFDCV